MSVKQLIQMINNIFHESGLFSTSLKPSSDNFLTNITKFLFQTRRLGIRFYCLPHQDLTIIFKKQLFIGFRLNKYSKESTCLKITFKQSCKPSAFTFI